MEFLSWLLATYSSDSDDPKGNINDIEYALDNIFVQGLDYAFMDFEPTGGTSANERTEALINLVRNHSNPAALERFRVKFHQA